MQSFTATAEEEEELNVFSFQDRPKTSRRKTRSKESSCLALDAVVAIDNRSRSLSRLRKARL